MMTLLQAASHGGSYMPHGMCYLWEPDLLWLHVISDLATGLAYYAIPPTLLVLVVRARRQVPEGAEYAARGLPHEWMFLAFGLFIVACGTTHFMAAWNVWNADYWIAGGVKAVTAVASIATAIALPPLIPRALRLVKQARESEVRRIRLEAANRELAELNDRLREMDALRTRLFANVSHELRTPLALIRGPVERLAESMGPGSVRDELDVVRRNAVLLHKRVDDLLDLARLDAGEMKLEPLATDVARIVRLCADRFASIARRMGTDYQVELPDSLPAQVDPHKFERIIDNLLSNAFKFAPERGTVRMTLQQAGDEIRIAVEDDGPGVPEPQRAEVFEPFRQVEGASRRYSGSAGLGLAIVRDFTRLHGGEAWVEQSALGGARFSVRIPHRPPEGPIAEWDVSVTVAAEAGANEVRMGQIARAGQPRRPDASADAEDRPRPRALVVEDNPDMLVFTARALEAEFDCDRAENGAVALDRLERAVPDIIVTDVMMPVMDGADLLTEIRSRPGLAGVPVIVLTAVAEHELRLQLLGAGAQDFLTKPFEPEELLVRARNLAAMKRAGDVLRRELESAGADVEGLASELAKRRQQLEIALLEVGQARDEAEAASRAKSDFLAVMSHELRTPLNAIIGYTDLIDAGVSGPVSDAQQGMLERIRIGARHLLRIIDDILAYARAESGPADPVVEPVDLVSLIDETVGMIRPEAELKKLRIETHVDAPPVVETDHERLRRIVTNLLANAVKFTTEGTVRIDARADDREITIAVSDTGQGIPPEYRERIFEPFWQIDQSSTRAAGGTGLGLSIAQRLVHQLGGDLDVDSQPGRGSTFTARVPL